MRIAWFLLAVLLPAVVAVAQSYTYDAAGRLTRAAYPQGGGVRYQYDSADNLLSVAPLNVPAAPSGVQVSRTGANTIQVSWSAVQGSSSYRIDRRAADGSAWQTVATVSASQQSYLDQTVQAGQDYVYRVSAVGSDGAGAYSNSASTADAPSTLPMISSVINGASFDPDQPIAPGSIVSLFGVNFGFTEADGQQTLLFTKAGNPPLPIELAGHSVTIGGRPAPLFFVAGSTGADGLVHGQINVQVPWQTAPGDAVPVVLRRSSGGVTSESSPANVRVAAVSPAIFTFASGSGPAAVVNIKASADDGVIDNSISQPVGSLPGASTQPALRGGVITIYCTGLGEVIPVARDGEDSTDALRKTATDPTVLIGGAPAKLLFSGLAPQFVGLYQINVQVPDGIATGDAVPIQIEIGGMQSRTDVTVAIR